VLIASLAWWALAGTVGLGLGAALTFLLMRRGDPEARTQHRQVIAWGLVASGAAVELATGALASRPPHWVGGAILVGGVLALSLAIDAPKSAALRWPRVGLLLAVPALAAAALVLPAPVWRVLYGASLLAAALWLAALTRERFPRAVFGLGAALLAAAGIVLAASGLRPPSSAGADLAVGVLMLAGLAALAAAAIAQGLAQESAQLRRRLTNLEEEHGHLLRLAETDPLTGCPNRQAMRAWFDRWEGVEPVSVVLVDVDGLKRINEKHGQAAGDEALRLLANVLSSSIRPGDLVVRWGGDEFVALLRGAGHEAAQRRFTRLIATLQDRAETFPYEEPLAVQWGVSTCSSADDIARALAEADERMYAMKRRQASTD
jgi:diguanylate cyclase (GGDEF)-like protein